MSSILHKGIKLLLVIPIILLATGIWNLVVPTISRAEKTEVESILPQKGSPILLSSQVRTGHYVLVHLDTMRLELRDGATILDTITMVSRGKPGSYYETIAGSYTNDYKELSHFSSIGHVYMPYSMHIFGNYFIHGIPYYADGTKVSSTYSGGCIRLADEDAKRVYDFIQRGTPIIITNGNETDFNPTATTTLTIESLDMTQLMVATISLEVVTQDNEIFDTDHIATTTRRKLIPRLLGGDKEVAKLYTNAVGEPAFIDYMNQKAAILGLTNTRFMSVTEPVQTTEEDYARFTNYIDTYKSYLRKGGSL